MDLRCVIAPSPLADWAPVQEESGSLGLARTKQGTLYRKHILSRGELLHPLTGTKINVDDAFVHHLKTNFANNVCDIVQVPLANDKNEHVENPAANLGEVLGIEDDPLTGKVYALIDARKHENDFGRTILGASCFLHTNYLDTKSGKRVGPTLLHVAATNRPYVTGLDPYEPVVAASAEYLGEPALMQMSGSATREGAVPRSVEEVLAELRTDHNIDVDELRAQLQTAKSAAVDTASAAADTDERVNVIKAELLNKINDAETRAKTAEDQLAATTTKLTAILSSAGVSGTDSNVKLTGSDNMGEDIVNAVSELASRNVALSAAQATATDRIAALEKRNVETEIDGLITEGRILPAKREAYVTMALSHRDLFEQIVPETPIVPLDQEKGTAPRAEEHKGREIDVEAELARLTAAGGPAAEYVRA